MYYHVAWPFLCWRLTNIAVGSFMDPAIAATVGSAAEAVDDDQMSRAAWSVADQGQGQDHDVQGHVALQGQANDYLQGVKGKGKRTDGRTTEALSHQDGKLVHTTLNLLGPLGS